MAGEALMKNARSLPVETLVKEPLTTVLHSEDIAHVEVAVLPCMDEGERFTRVEHLKARIESGTYTINSQALAQTLQQSLFVQMLL